MERESTEPSDIDKRICRTHRAGSNDGHVDNRLALRVCHRPRGGQNQGRMSREKLSERSIIFKTNNIRTILCKLSFTNSLNFIPNFYSPLSLKEQVTRLVFSRKFFRKAQIESMAQLREKIKGNNSSLRFVNQIFFNCTSLSTVVSFHMTSLSSIIMYEWYMHDDRG